MSRKRFDEALVEDLERDLRDALRIEPSPDFAQKVRARIAAKPLPSVRWTYGLAAAAVCVLAVGLGVWMESREAAPAEAPMTPRRDVHLTIEVPVTAAVAPVEAATNVRKIPAKLRPVQDPKPEPEVIVPPDRALALARFLQLARQGTVSEETLQPVASAAPAPVLEIAPLVVAPLSVPELEPQSGAAEGGADRE